MNHALRLLIYDSCTDLRARQPYPCAYTVRQFYFTDISRLRSLTLLMLHPSTSPFLENSVLPFLRSFGAPSLAYFRSSAALLFFVTLLISCFLSLSLILSIHCLQLFAVHLFIYWFGPSCFLIIRSYVFWVFRIPFNCLFVFPCAGLSALRLYVRFSVRHLTIIYLRGNKRWTNCNLNSRITSLLPQ